MRWRTALVWLATLLYPLVIYFGLGRFEPRWLALFLLITALPWTTVWGAGFKQLRLLGEPAVRQDWSAGRAAEHAEHLRDMSAATLATRVSLDDIVRRVTALHLDPPVRVYLPSDRQPFWRVRSETQNRPRVRELELDARTGELLATLELALGQEHARLRGDHLRLRAVDLGGVGCRIDRDQQVALLHQRTLAEMRRLHGAGDARTHLDAFDRLEAAGELVPQCDVALFHGRDRHRRRRHDRRRIVRLRAAAAENEVGCRTCADRNGDRHRGNADEDQRASNREFFHHGLLGRCPRHQIQTLTIWMPQPRAQNDLLQREAT